MTLTAEIMDGIRRAGAADVDFETRVTRELEALKVKRQAKRLLDAEDRGPVLPPQIETLRARLARPRSITHWTIDGWLPRRSRVVISAQFKAGKTTLIGNYLRARADGDRWLGQASVTQAAGSIALFDFEMGDAQLDDWLREQRIHHDDRIVVISMRGRAAAFNILDDAVRAQYAEFLRQHQAEDIVLDCLRPILDALGLDEHRDAGRFLVAFDALLVESGATTGIVVHHMGHTGERARGDSRLRDWPDVEWRLVRQDDDPASPRFITAYGRDVDVPESRLLYDSATRRLTIEGGSRQDVKTTRVLDAVVEALGAIGEPLSGRRVKAALEETDHSRDAIDAALHAGVRSGRLTVEKGPRHTNLYRVSGSVRMVSAEHSSERVSECPSVFSKTDTPDTSRALQSTESVSVSGSDTRSTDGRRF